VREAHREPNAPAGGGLHRLLRLAAMPIH
jgi:hypothetical protein